MKTFILETICTGVEGVTPHTVHTTIMVAWDSHSGSLNGGVDPVTGQLYSVWKTHGEYKGFETSCKFAGMAIPCNDEKDCLFVEEATSAYKKLRRRIEDRLRKGGANQIAAVGGIIGDSLLINRRS